MRLDLFAQLSHEHSLKRLEDAMRGFVSSPTWLGVLGLLSGCFATRQELATQKQLCRAAQKRTAAVEKETSQLWREVTRLSSSQDQAILELQRTVHDLDAQSRQLKTTLQACDRDLGADKRPRPHVLLGELRFAEKKHRSFRPQVQRLLTGALPQIEHCYRLYGSSEGQSLRGAFWLMFGFSAAGVAQPLAHQSRWNTGDTLQTARLQGCVIALFKRKAPEPRGGTAVGQLLVMADTAASARGIQLPALEWPWKPLQGVGRENEVCSMGANRFRLSWAPSFGRPCAPGLKCCYPCGIPGCDSVCKRDCGPPGRP